MMNKYCKYVNILRSLKCGNFQILHIFEQSFVSKCIKLSCQRFHVIPFFSSSDQHTFIIRFSDPKPGRSLQVHLINHTFLLVNSFLQFFVESTAQQTIQMQRPLYEKEFSIRREFLIQGYGAYLNFLNIMKVSNYASDNVSKCSDVNIS